MMTNDILIACNLLERTISMLQPGTRTAVQSVHLKMVQNSIGGVYEKVLPYTKDNSILCPLAEGVELLKILLADPRLVETDVESKEILITKFSDALHELYLFAGKFYASENEFDRKSPALDTLLIKIVNVCLDHGFYFGVDKEVQV